MRRKIISYICLIAMLTDYVPVYALPNATTNVISSEIKEESTESTSEKYENKETVSEESTLEETENKKNTSEDLALEETESKENTSQEPTLEETENKTVLKDYMFNMYILNEEKVVNNEEELGFSISFDEEESQFIVSNQSEKQLSKENLNTIIYKINIYDKENKEKLNIELLGSDTGNSEKLNILKETKYEIGDSIKISSFDPKHGLKISGDIQGDINKEKEDYSDGVDDLDYIQNVRFEITEEGLKSVYNEAPIIHGLTDLKDVTDENLDIFKGISVTDDHDKEIDTSSIETELKQVDELVTEVTYTVTDSWGRTTSGSRTISGIKLNNNSRTLSLNRSSSSSRLSDVLITVGGITYAGGAETRFRLKFDVPSSTIKVIEADSRVMNNQVDGDYFKFELYDKEMKLKKSVTLVGKDKSNSDKVKELNNLKYINGDHIYIWHKESSEKLKISGNIVDGTEGDSSTNLNYENGVAEENLINHRFEITPIGLKSIKNTAPVITDLPEITVTRGGEIDYWTGVKINDDKDQFTEDTVKSGKVSVSHTKVDTSVLGTHEVVYTATDSWGLSGTAKRTVIVSGTNPIESKFIEVYNKQNNLAFKIGFDAVSKTYMITEANNQTQLDSTTDNIVFKFRVFSENGMLKKTVNIKGTDTINQGILSKINGFKYEEGDYIELWSIDSKNGLKIVGGVGNTKEESSVDGSENENSGNTDSGNTEAINVENQSTDNNQNVDISNGIPENYEDGIDNPDYMNNVRFKILGDGLEATYNEAPKLNFETMTVIRGNEVNYLDGVTVSDDHDKENDKLKAKVTYKKIDTNTTGVKSVEYRLTDSWGRTTIAKRTITVTDKSILETNKINVKGKNGVIFSLGFDSITKKYIVRDINLNNLPEDVSGNVFKMTVYREKTTKTESDFEVKDTVTITADDLQNKKFVSRFEELSFADDDYISLWSYNYQNGIEVKLNGNELYIFENDEKMNNTRFKIKESSGLEKIYNAAPEIDIDTDFYILKGSDIDLNSVVSVNDEIDGNIKSKLITTGLEQVDKNTVGTYKVNYKVSDSWGRTTSKDVNMHVVSNSVSNDIEFYSVDNTQKIFSLKYNPMRNRFEVNKTNTAITVTTDTNDTSTDDTVSDGTVTNDKVFGLTVFNKNSEEIHKIELNESQVQDINELNKILEFDVQDGYYFSLWSDNPKRIRIKGNMISNRGAEKEDYTDGIDNEDQMINVRFKITETGLQHIYNEAPIIHGIKELEAYAGDIIEYLDGITVSDTLDGEIDNSKIIITNGSDQPLDNINDEGKISIGNDNIIKYTVEDSWGRKTTETTNLTIKEGMLKNKIRLQGGPDLNTHNDIVTITFDTENMQIKLEQKNEHFNQAIGNGIRYYGIKLIGSDGRNKLQDGSGNNSIDSIRGTDTGTSERFAQLNDLTFEYGDKFELFAWHPHRLEIDGKVINAREDYTDGFDIPMNLINAQFEITHSGLKSIYTEKVEPTVNQKNIFAAIAPEGYVFKYSIEPGHGIDDGGKIKVIEKNNYSMWYEKGNADVAKIAIYNKDGTVKKEKTYTGSINGHSMGNYFHEFEYKNGDYLFLQHMDSKRFAIYGNVKGQKEDYSDGFEEVTDMRNTIFRFTSEGLEAVYNEAPVINGIEDTVSYLGEDFRELEGVSITDEDKWLRIPEVVNTTVNTTQIGEYNVEYSARDSWGRTTTATRKVTVVPRIYDNRFKIYSDSESDTQEDNNSDGQSDSGSGSEANENSDSSIEITNTDNNENLNDDSSDAESTTKEPIFEIGFDPLNDKYKVYNQRADRLSEKYLADTAFDIEIRNQQGETKAKVTLTGNDRGTSPKLEVINNTDYVYGDTIQVYRRDHKNGIKITGTIENPNNKVDEDYSDGINNADYMNNVRFTVKQDNLETVYNEAAQITDNSDETIINNTTITKGSLVDLLKNIQVNDDNSNLSTEDIDIYLNGNQIEKDYTFDQVGKYKLSFMLVDSWGRVTLKEVDISVESKVKENDINVYDNSDNLRLKIGFDTSKDKIVVKEPSNISKSSNNDTDYFTMTVRDKKGNTKYSITLNGDVSHDRAELEKIHEKDYSKYDTISLWGTTHETVKITGDVVGTVSDSTIDYDNGFGSEEKYTQVRFMITDDGLKELKTAAPTLNGIDPVSIKRGDTIEFMDGVFANLEDASDEDYNITVDSKGFNNMVEGTYNVKYNVTTNRGVNKEYDRKVTVEPRTELESVKLKINKDSNGTFKNILTIGFDTITNKLKVLNHSESDVMPGASDEVALRLTAYDESGSNIANIELRGNASINKEFVDKVNAFIYQEGYSLSIWYKEVQNVTIDGKVEGNTQENAEDNTEENAEDSITNYNQGTNNNIDIQNSRFTIKEDGVKYVYNAAPVIKGHDSPLVYYKGQILDPFKGISITDDHDKNITTHDIIYDDTNVDLDQPGDYTMKYIAEDSWGRTAEFTRTIIVKSGLGLNKIEFYSLRNISGSTEQGTEGDSQGDSQGSVTEDAIEGITQYNAEGFAEGTIGGATGDTVEDTTEGNTENTANSKVFDIGFENGKVKIGSKSNLQLDSSNPENNIVTIKIYNKSMEAVKSVTLKGNDTGNSEELNKLAEYDIQADDFISIEGISEEFAQNGIKITGTVLDEREPYSDGINNIDNINNVRFKSTEFGLQSVYNEAPTITFDGELDALLGDGKEIDFTKGATIKDDHDILGEDNINVTGLENAHSVGRYSVTYTVTDSWGTQTTKERNVYLYNALDYDTIEFMGHRNETDHENVEVALKMRFDTKNMKIRVSEGEDIYFRKGNGSNIQYRVTLVDNNGDVVMTKEVRGDAKANAANLAFRDLDNADFKYGYKIRLFAWHQDLLRIQGPVREAREDYSDGAQLGDSYTNVEFEITEAGLKSIYTQDSLIDGDKVNIIAPSSREGHPFKLRVDINNRRIQGMEGKEYSIEYGTNEEALKIILYDGQTDQQKRIIAMTGNENGGSKKANYLNGDFEYGDYITIWHRTPKNISIKGDIINPKEDYSDGIDDEEYMNHVSFKLTDQGMECIYVAPPTIQGASDKVFIKGDTITDATLKAGVSATDANGEDLTDSINMTHDVDATYAGLYDITYTVRDENDVVTSVTATVEVQAKPEIYVNRGKETIELNSLKNLTPTELEARLKEIVNVVDEEDDALNKPVKLDVEYEGIINSTELGGTHTVKYTATDSHGHQTEKNVNVQIIRTINVSVPTVIPFQVVTNLVDKTQESFVSGVMKLKNNNTSDVKVYLQSFTTKETSTTKNGSYKQLEIVAPETFENWDTLSEEDSMTKMALGIYNKSGLNVNSSRSLTESSPLWLTSGMNAVELGSLTGAHKMSTPYEANIGFTSKHGKNFIGGASRAKFDLVFRFE